jgi:hypothetical protein
VGVNLRPFGWGLVEIVTGVHGEQPFYRVRKSRAGGAMLTRKPFAAAEALETRNFSEIALDPAPERERPSA